VRDQERDEQRDEQDERETMSGDRQHDAA